MTQETKEEIANVGDLFKSRREERNISLKEAANATSIRMNYLKGIEDNQVHLLISPVYAQGFVKQYAAFLGMDGEQIVREYPDFFQRPDSQEFSYGIGTLEVRGNPGGGVKWLPNVFWLVGFAVVVGAAWYLARFLEVL